jgi:hypothetical protein
MSARPGLCGGHRATGVPTAIADYGPLGVYTLGMMSTKEPSWQRLPIGATILARGQLRSKLAKGFVSAFA